MHECRKCPYYKKENKESQLRAGRLIVGFCGLRDMHISDVTITNTTCKDRAVISLK
jgi:hypothetical protein